MMQIGMFFVQQSDMNSIVLQKKSNKMKKASLLGVIVLGLIVVIVLFFSRSIDDSNSKNVELIDERVLSNSLQDAEIQDYEDMKRGLDAPKGVGESKGDFNGAVSPASVSMIQKQSDTLNLRDFGVVGNGENETTGFQKALNSAVGKVLYIPKQQGRYYLTNQLLVPSNSTLIFDSNVIMQASDDLEQKQPRFEVLFRIQSAQNVVIKGNNALFRMNKQAYTGEHNHIFMINGSTNITLDNVRANDSGGDGVYVGAFRTPKKFSENVQIKNVKTYNNRRQGLSVISARGLYVNQCEFAGTNGTLPEAGVDVEPSLPSDVLEEIHFKDCTAIGNKGRGFSVILIKIDASSRPVDITFQNCKAEGNNVGFSNRYFSEGTRGIVRFVDCVAEGSEEAGFWEGSCAASGAAKEYIRCIATNNHVGKITTDNLGQYAGFRISNFAKRKKKVLGNSTFIDCEAINNGRQSRMDYGLSAAENATFQNVEIKNFVSKGHGKEALNIDIKGGRTKAGILVTQ